MVTLHAASMSGRWLTAACAALLLQMGSALSADATTAERLAEGKALAMGRAAGNCLACHAFDDGELPGNIGPPLVHMQQRFPDRAALRAQIWDATVRNPNTIMPPFGRHRILGEDEIELIVDYIYSL